MGQVIDSVREFWYYGLPVVVVPIVLGILWWLYQRRGRRAGWQEAAAEGGEKTNGRVAAVDAIVFKQGIETRRRVPLAMIEDPERLTCRQIQGSQVVLLEEAIEEMDGRATRETEAAASA